jgi:hypothetical protein
MPALRRLESIDLMRGLVMALVALDRPLGCIQRLISTKDESFSKLEKGM